MRVESQIEDYPGRCVVTCIDEKISAIALRRRYRPYHGRPRRPVQRAGGCTRTGTGSLDGEASQPDQQPN